MVHLTGTVAPVQYKTLQVVWLQTVADKGPSYTVY